MTTEVQDKSTGRWTIKTVISYTLGVIGIASIYFDIKSSITNNREILQEIKADTKEKDRLSEARLRDIEASQRTTDIRLTIIETQLKK